MKWQDPMFDLEQSIAEWRRQMTVGGVKNPGVLDELESHLREDLERQTRTGIDVQNAFAAAVKKIGSAGALKNEFNKSTASTILEKMMIAAAVLVLVFGALLSIATL